MKRSGEDLFCVVDEIELDVVMRERERERKKCVCETVGELWRGNECNDGYRSGGGGVVNVMEKGFRMGVYY